MQTCCDADNVYDVTYMKAVEEMALIEQEIQSHVNVGFKSEEDCDKFAHDNNLDIFIVSKMGKTFYRVSHLGDVISERDALRFYDQVLFWYTPDHKGRLEKCRWGMANRYELFRNARIMSEESDGLHDPLYYRDYFRPTGYYSREAAAFNIATPFPVFARETQRDTSHIHELIKHISGECYMWVLAWLRQKMIEPTRKTEIMPVFTSVANGTGKTTFVNEICVGLFGKANVIASDQYDSSARFNSDYADKLIVGLEEKKQEDKRNEVGALKSRVTATRIRKENKGVDPIYQDSYTEYVMTTNDMVPLKFDSADQRRFMVMSSDETFTRKSSAAADEVFTKIYGEDAFGNKTGTPFHKDNELIAQFKHELFENAELANLNLKQFPKTDAYHRCFSLPRTNDSVEIDALIKSLVPFIKESLEQKMRVELLKINDEEELKLSDVAQSVQGLIYSVNRVGLNQFLIFTESMTNRPYSHASIERAINNARSWLHDEYDLDILPTTEPPSFGFRGVHGRFRYAPTFWFVKAKVKEDTVKTIQKTYSYRHSEKDRLGERMRCSLTRFDRNGDFETVNDVLPTATSRRSENAASLDTFLFESDNEISSAVSVLERKRSMTTTNAEEVFAERLNLQLSEATRLFNVGIACRIVYSGAKSYHILVRVADPPRSLEEYKWLHAHLRIILSKKLQFDESCCDPLRLTRFPTGAQRRSTFNGVDLIGEQKLMMENFNNLFHLNWRNLYNAWLSRPLTTLEKTTGRRLIPSKPEYTEAAHAVASGEFWTSEIYHGDRQRLFFPAYRILRELGFSRDQLWSDDGMFEGIENYYKPGEIEYWKKRQFCDLVATIDKEFDDE